MKAYAHDLKDYLEYLELRGVDWRQVTLEQLGGFNSWLQLPPGARAGLFSVLPAVTAHCTASTVNRKWAAVTSFYTFHARRGVEIGDLLTASRGRRSMATAWRPYLDHLGADAAPRAQSRALRLKQSRRRPQLLTPEQTRALVGACEHRRDKLLVSLLATTGIRVGEALGLRHEDIDTPRRLLRVRLRRNSNGARAKTLEREVPVPSEVLRLHADYLFEEYGPIDSDYLFIRLWQQPVGAALTYTAVYDLGKRLTRRTGIEFNFHWFRHTYATSLLQQGVRLEVVAQLLGHASVATTIDTYGHLTVEDTRAALERAGFLSAEPVGATR